MKDFLKSVTKLLSIPIQVLSEDFSLDESFSINNMEGYKLDDDDIENIKNTIINLSDDNYYIEYSNPYFLTWIIIKLNKAFIIIGPIIPENFNYDYFSKILESYQLSPNFDRSKITMYQNYLKMDKKRLNLLAEMVITGILEKSDITFKEYRKIVVDFEDQYFDSIFFDSPALSLWDEEISAELLVITNRIIRYLKLEEYDKVYIEERNYFDTIIKTVKLDKNNFENFQKSIEYSIISIHTIMNIHLIERGVPTMEILECINAFAFLMSGLDKETDLSALVIEMSKKYLDLLQHSSIEVYDYRINKVLDFILQNYNKSITLKDAADIVDMEPKNLSKLFKKEMGIGFKHYIEEKRLSRVKKLLKHSELSILDVLIDVGFKDQANFTRWFKDKTGITPGEFRSTKSK